MIIREARLEEVPQLKIIEQEIIRYERPFDPNLKDDPISYYDLEDLIKRDDACVIVACFDDEIIGSGYALIKTSKPYKNPNQYAYLGFMFVSPNFRGKGINGKIIDHLIKWAKTKGLKEIQLDVYAENKSAVKAYEKRNFKPDLLKMRLSIDE